uniref:Uncharacterized protein n=1 Tax=Anguilla anguilla TaxID=7936 RepID=A0A0E9R125_ANGAN
MQLHIFRIIPRIDTVFDHCCFNNIHSTQSFYISMKYYNILYIL